MSLTIETPLGPLALSVSTQGTPLDTSRYTLENIQPTPILPTGISVDSLYAPFLTIQPGPKLFSLRFECRWLTAPPCTGPESGECLDAQSWETDSQRVTIGTEDYDRLSSRHPALGLQEAVYPVEYSDSSLTLLIPVIPENRTFSFHFVVASRHLPDPRELSTWLAVDIDHEKIKAGLTVPSSESSKTIDR